MELLILAVDARRRNFQARKGLKIRPIKTVRYR
jgi:hypothetical protein